MFTDQDIGAFRAWGLIRLPGFMPAPAVRRVRDAVLAPLAHSGAPPPQWPSAGDDAKLIRHCALVDALIEKCDVRFHAEALLGGACERRLTSAAVLYTPQNAEAWFVPHNMWRVDIPRLSVTGCWGGQVFGLLDRVAPGGGGTLVVAGSHRLVNEGRFVRSKDVKQSLARDAYFNELFDAHAPDRECFLHDAHPSAEGVPLRVVEMTGEAGDAYLMDMRALHTAAPNAAQRARLMFTQRFVRADCLSEAFGGDADEG